MAMLLVIVVAMAGAKLIAWPSCIDFVHIALIQVLFFFACAIRNLQI